MLLQMVLFNSFLLLSHITLYICTTSSLSIPLSTDIQVVSRSWLPVVFFFFTNLFIYLFIFGCVGSLLLCMGFLQLRRATATLHCLERASHCGSFSCCRAWALSTRASVVVAHGLQSAGSVVVACGLQSAGSVVVVHGLSCSVACGIFLDQGSNPCPLHWQVDSYPLRHQGSPPSGFLNGFCVLICCLLVGRSCFFCYLDIS